MKIFVFIFILFNIGYWPVRHAAGPALRRHLGPAFYFAATSTFFAGFAAPNALVFLPWCALVACLGVRTRMDVACRFALLMPLMPAVSPYLVAGGHVLGQFSPSIMVALGAAVMTLVVRGRSPGEPGRGLGAEDAAIAALILIFGVGPVRFENVFDLIRTVMPFVAGLLVPYWVIHRNVHTRAELQLVAACLGCSAAILGVMALYEHHSSWALFDGMTRRFSNSYIYLARSASVRGGALRASTTMAGPIELGMFLIVGLIGAYSARRLFANKTIWWGMLGVILLGVLVTQSRLAVAGTALGLLIVLVVQGRTGLAALFSAGAMAGYLFLLALARSSMRVAAFLGAGKQVAGYRDYRGLLLDRGLEEGRKHLWLGAPMKDVTARLQDLTQGEQIIDFVNTYLNIFLVSGIIGLGAFLIALGLVFLPLLKPIRRNRRSPEEMARAFTLAVLAGLVAQLVGTSFVERVPFMLAIALACSRVIRTSTNRRAITPAASENRYPEGPLRMAATPG